MVENAWQRPGWRMLIIFVLSSFIIYEPLVATI
jgi:hypothetical protein